MKFDKPFITLVIVGGWNRHIFTPNWIKRYLFPDERDEFKMEIQAQFPQGFNEQFVSPRISSKEVRILLQGNRLNFSPVKNEDKNFDRIQELALQLADYLPHTPVSGYGVNFLFTEDPTEHLIDLIRPNDLEEIAKFGTVLIGEEYTRRLVLNERTLNFTVGFKDGKITLSFNFHFDIRDLAEFKAKILEAPILTLKQEAVEFIAGIYGLELKGGTE